MIQYCRVCNAPVRKITFDPMHKNAVETLIKNPQFNNGGEYTRSNLIRYACGNFHITYDRQLNFAKVDNFNRDADGVWHEKSMIYPKSVWGSCPHAEEILLKERDEVSRVQQSD